MILPVVRAHTSLINSLSDLLTPTGRLVIHGGHAHGQRGLPPPQVRRQGARNLIHVFS